MYNAGYRKGYPSEIAVFPTPGSPMRTGLFLVLLDKIWMHLRISSSLPITGSSFPALAIAVKSLPYFSNDSYFPSGSEVQNILGIRMSWVVILVQGFPRSLSIIINMSKIIRMFYLGLLLFVVL